MDETTKQMLCTSSHVGWFGEERNNTTLIRIRSVVQGRYLKKEHNPPRGPNTIIVLSRVTITFTNRRPFRRRCRRRRVEV